MTLFKADVSTRREPVGGRPLKNPPVGGETSTGVASFFLCMRCNNEIEHSLGSLFDRSRLGVFADGGGTPSAPGATPETGSSVCMKQHRFPYGQAPETQNVYEAHEHGSMKLSTIPRTLQISVLYCRNNWLTMETLVTGKITLGCRATARSSSSP